MAGFFFCFAEKKTPVAFTRVWNIVRDDNRVRLRHEPGAIPLDETSLELPMEAGNVAATAKAFALPEHRIRTWIKEGRLVPRAAGRRSVILFEDVRAVIRLLPPTPSSRARINAQRETNHAD